MEHAAAGERWASWEVVEMRWPFDIDGETWTAGHFESACREMWSRLREVALTAFEEEEARVGRCVFDVMAERGVIRREEVDGGGAERIVGRVQAVIWKVRARLRFRRCSVMGE